MRYRERLAPPVYVWVLGLALAAMFGVAFGAAYGTTVGVVVALIALAVVGMMLLAVSDLVAVDRGLLRAGRARLPVAVIGGVTALDRTATKRLLGVDADARAYLALRAWARTGVRVDLDDPDDPTPYWFVSSRRPQELAAAVADEREADLAASWEQTAD